MLLQYNTTHDLRVILFHAGTNWVAEIVRHIMFQDEELEDITQHLPFQFFLLEVGTSTFEEMVINMYKSPRKFRRVARNSQGGGAFLEVGNNSKRT